MRFTEEEKNPHKFLEIKIFGRGEFLKWFVVASSMANFNIFFPFLVIHIHLDWHVYLISDQECRKKRQQRQHKKYQRYNTERPKCFQSIFNDRDKGSIVKTYKNHHSIFYNRKTTVILLPLCTPLYFGH